MLLQLGLQTAAGLGAILEAARFIERCGAAGSSNDKEADGDMAVARGKVGRGVIAQLGHSVITCLSGVCMVWWIDGLVERRVFLGSEPPEFRGHAQKYYAECRPQFLCFVCHLPLRTV